MYPGSYTSIIYQDERVGDTQCERRFSILKEEIVQLFVTAVELSDVKVRSQLDQVHILTNGS